MPVEPMYEDTASMTTADWMIHGLTRGTLFFCSLSRVCRKRWMVKRVSRGSADAIYRQSCSSSPSWSTRYSSSRQSSSGTLHRRKIDSTAVGPIIES